MREIKNTKGQTMVEFALIISLFLAILFGIVEFGRLWYYSNHLGNSVRAAARYGAVFAHQTGISATYKDIGTITSSTEAYATQEISSFMTVDNGQLQGVDAVIFHNTTSLLNSGTPQRGDTIKVTAWFNMQILTGTIIPYFDGNKLIRRSASMPIE